MKPDHAIMKGFGGFCELDETYVHEQREGPRPVLEVRAEGGPR
ncbi:MAG: hypothetical protein U0791_12240 [Gemmataceae bacterium]